MQKSQLTCEDYRNFVIDLHFRYRGDDLSNCIHSGYIDLQRTLRGIGRFENNKAVKQQAYQFLHQQFTDIAHRVFDDQAQFDEWHRTVCEKLAATYHQNGWEAFYIGQSQKWVNMTFKYIFIFGDGRLPGYQSVYAFCHVPLDNILLDQMQNYGFDDWQHRWSRIPTYDAYMSYQTWFRSRFEGIPLDVEFKLWRGDTDIDLKPL
jgi:hypothetical protein